jgi:Tol biopolymer transport system component
MTASGHDDDRTQVIKRDQDDAPSKKRSPWLYVGVIGCAGLLCLGLVVGGAALLLPDKIDIGGLVGGKTSQPTEVAVKEETPEPTQAPVETPQAEKTPEAAETPTKAAVKPTATEVVIKPTPTGGISKGGIQLSTPTSEAAETPPATTPTTAQEPTIDPIVFATGVTDDNQPIGAGITFPEDIEEIHAIFDYAGMSDGDTWERRWYQDGEDMGGGSGAWDGGESGTFDLSLDGGGEPLGAGTWKLEIYVNGELARSGTFVIEASAAPTSPPVARTYKIAFARWDGGKHNLYVANTDGSGERFLMEWAAGPSWSSDGQYLSFYGEQGVATQVRDGVPYYREDITDGILMLNFANWTDDITQVEIEQKVREGSGRWTDWAPSGGMLAFDAARGSPDRRIYFLGTADNQQYSIEIPGEQASWAPDSNQLVYRSGRDGKQGIWISNRDDSGAHNITTDGTDSLPSWSPDGRKIAFHRDSGGNVDIYVMNVDGSDIRRLTDAPGPDTLPAWTPDGRIVFRSARTGSWSIYMMNADGNGQKEIIPNADPGPDWSFGRMDVY